MKAAFDHFTQETSSVRTYYFRPERPVRFEAGQFIELYLTLPSGETDVRWFTLSNAPHEPLLAVTTRHSVADASPYKQLLAALRPGDQVTMTDPMGDFVMPLDTSRKLVFVALGIGITPFRSMAVSLPRSDDTRDIVLLYVARAPEDILFQDALQNGFGDGVTYFCTNPPQDWKGEQGPITADRIVEHASADALIYIAGPEQAVHGLTLDLRHSGISPNRVVADYFSGSHSV